MGDKIISISGEYMLPDLSRNKVGDSVYLHRVMRFEDGPSPDELLLDVLNERPPSINREIFILMSMNDSIVEFSGGTGDVTFNLTPTNADQGAR